ncbi:MAG: iron-containing alcohol dehydrogenase, partial [Clostridia bacterium]|nr:iron-containing alcohol dehydrogenase [Clostridia bacterium]
MNGFLYNAPTKVYFGQDSDEKLTEIIKEKGCKCVLVHYGCGSAVKSGLIKRVKWALEHANVKAVELGGVMPNPRLSLVYEGIKLCKA